MDIGDYDVDLILIQHGQSFRGRRSLEDSSGFSLEEDFQYLEDVGFVINQ